MIMQVDDASLNSEKLLKRIDLRALCSVKERSWADDRKSEKKSTLTKENRSNKAHLKRGSRECAGEETLIV